MANQSSNKAEHALIRAEEFLSVGKVVRALEVLTESIKNRKHRIWQKAHEDVMRKFIQLCVDLKQSQTAKEGLHQYKNLTANVNPKSLEDIIRYYLGLSEAKCEEARAKANVQAATPVADVDDLDLVEPPEGMLLKAVSTDTSQDRADRVVLLPWVRFNWEAYRHCLDLLRNLSKLEGLYHDIASHAFKFCMKYVRKTELRKLCEMLRNHIGQISKREVITANAVNLNNPETQELNLKTRLVQLDHAIAMEMWQEAFRAIEDVQNLMSMLKKVPKAALKANYFEKLALVFLRAGNAVFHAAAQHQLFNLYRNYRKDLNTDELRKLAITVLFATLAVPLQPPRTHLESLLEYDESAASKMKQLTMLVSFNQPPTRAKLVEDLNRLGIMQFVRPDLQQLYQYLEMSFDPLHMGSQISVILGTVNSDEELSFVRHYVKVIEEVAVGKQLRQLAQAFDTIQISRVTQLMPYTDWHTIERVAIETARNTDLEVRIDHRDPGLFVFGSEVTLAPYEPQPGEGPADAQIPTDRVRSQLVMLLTSLTKIQRDTKSKDAVDEETRVRTQLFQLYRKNSSRDHISNLQRGIKTENRQKYLQDREKEKELQANEKKRNRDRESEVAETLRMERDTKQFEEQRFNLKKKELEKAALREKIEKMKQSEFGIRVLKELTDVDLDNMEITELTKLEQRHREDLKREEEENLARLKVQEKKIDHTIRAKHLEEVPLRKEYNAHMVQMFKEVWAEDERQRIALEREQHEFMTKKHEKMVRMKEQHDIFLNLLQQRNQKLYNDKMNAWKKEMEKVRDERLDQRRQERILERRNKWETEQKAKEEAQRREAEKQHEEAEKQKKAAAEAEIARKHKETQEKQAAKLKEIDERQAREDADRFAKRPIQPQAPLGRSSMTNEPPRYPVQVGAGLGPASEAPTGRFGALAERDNRGFDDRDREGYRPREIRREDGPRDTPRRDFGPGHAPERRLDDTHWRREMEPSDRNRSFGGEDRALDRNRPFGGEDRAIDRNRPFGGEDRALDRNRPFGGEDRNRPPPMKQRPGGGSDGSWRS